MATFDDADPGALLADQAALIGILIIHMRPLHTSVCKSFLVIMRMGTLTMVLDFRIGIPMFTSVRLLPNHMKPPIGKPDWNLLFGFILARMSHLRFLSTVYVLVDDRDLTNLDILTLRYSIGLLWLPGGLAVPACRVQLVSSVTWCSSPSEKASGLHLVHHTWAGTFVLAALCLVFPGLIVLLDSDRVPVTLFEVEDLWQEAQRLQHCGFPGPSNQQLVGA